MGGGPEGRGSQDVSGKTVTLRTFSLLTAASLSKMQICEMVITVASPSFMGLVFFCFLAHFVSPPLSTVLPSYHSGHASVFDECVSSRK